MKKIALIFVIAFVLDTLWQNLHVFLFANYKGGPITEFILLRAVLFDTITILIIALPFLFLSEFKKRSWIIIPVGIFLSILIEWYGLSTHRWAYNSLMPIIPFLSVGLTPTIQLGFLGYLSFKIQERVLQ